MSDEDDIGQISEALETQFEESVARDLAIKLLARLVSRSIGHKYLEIVQGHVREIEEADPDYDVRVNRRIAAHFRQLMLNEDEDDDFDLLSS